MTLRIVLLGLVASMGFDLPGGPDLESWARSGREWAASRMADLTGPVVEADRPDGGPTGCLQAEAPAPIAPPAVAEAPEADDAAFVAASEATAADFAADLAATRDGRPPIENAPSTLAAELPAVGLPDGEELAARAAPAVEEIPAEVAASDDATAGADEAPSRADRISSAVRLSREAARAWADLLLESADESGPAR